MSLPGPQKYEIKMMVFWAWFCFPRGSRYQIMKDLGPKAIRIMVFKPYSLNSEVLGPSGS